MYVYAYIDVLPKECGSLTLTILTVNGIEDHWTVWSRCDNPCGNGTQNRSRVCMGPLYGGDPCPLHMHEMQDCFVMFCPG